MALDGVMVIINAVIPEILSGQIITQHLLTQHCLAAITLMARHNGSKIKAPVRGPAAIRACKLYQASACLMRLEKICGRRGLLRDSAASLRNCSTSLAYSPGT